MLQRHAIDFENIKTTELKFQEEGGALIVIELKI